MKPHQMSAAEATHSIRCGDMSAEDLVVDCLERIDMREPEVHAWRHLDRDHALSQARAADAKHQRGEGLGRLHGIPVAVKDIFDTADLPTEWGSSVLEGRRPHADSAAVARLRDDRVCELCSRPDP